MILLIKRTTQRCDPGNSPAKHDSGWHDFLYFHISHWLLELKHARIWQPIRHRELLCLVYAPHCQLTKDGFVGSCSLLSTGFWIVIFFFLLQFVRVCFLCLQRNQICFNLSNGSQVTSSDASEVTSAVTMFSTSPSAKIFKHSLST